MQTFRFRLERVLEWYRRKCRIEENRLAEGLEAMRQLDTRIARFQAERVTIERDLLVRTEVPAADFASLGRYRLRAREQDAEFGDQRKRQERSIAEQRIRVHQAQRKVRLVEKLRERRLAEYTAAFDKELEAVAAEAYMAQFHRS